MITRYEKIVDDTEYVDQKNHLVTNKILKNIILTGLLADSFNYKQIMAILGHCIKEWALKRKFKTADVDSWNQFNTSWSIVLY